MIFRRILRTTLAGISSIKSTVSSKNISFITFSSSASENASMSTASSSPSISTKVSAASSFGRTLNISGILSRGISSSICAISAGSRSSSVSFSSEYFLFSISESAKLLFSSKSSSVTGSGLSSSPFIKLSLSFNLTLLSICVSEVGKFISLLLLLPERLSFRMFSFKVSFSVFSSIITTLSDVL